MQEQDASQSNISAGKDACLLLVGQTEVCTTHGVSSLQHLLQQNMLIFQLQQQ